MRTIITILFAFAILFQVPAFAIDEKTKTSKKTTAAKKSTVTKRTTSKKPVKKKVVKVEELDRQVSPQVKNAILVTGGNIAKLAAKQVTVNGHTGRANMLVPYHSYLVDTSLTAHINVRYEDSKDFHTDKVGTKKYIVTIHGDQSNFMIKYTSHDRKYSVKYRYPDYSLKRKPTRAEMEREIMNALAAINKRGKQKKLTLQNY